MSWTLLHPEALAFLILAPLILLLHFVRKRPRLHGVPFLRIWERAEPRAGGGFKRLRDRLALLLALLLVVLLTLALARPVRPPPEHEHVLIVVDNSASMDALEIDGHTRFEKALKRLRDDVARAPEQLRFALATTAPAPALLVPFNAPRSQVPATLAGLKPRPLPGDTASAVRDLAPLLHGLPGGRIWLVSDALPDEIPDRTKGDVPVHRMLVGDRADNVRIAAFTGAWGGWWDASASFFVRVENSSEEPASCTLAVRAGEDTLVEEALELEGMGAFEKTFHFERGNREVVFFAEVKPGGALNTDDRAWCCVPGRKLRRVLLISRAPSAFVQSAIQGLGDWVDREHSGVVDPASWEKVVTRDDLTVFEGTGPGASFPEGGCLVVGAPPETLPDPPPGAKVKDAAVLEWDSRFPVTTGLSFDGVFFRAFRPLPACYKPLVSTEHGTAVGAREGPTSRAVVLSASLEDTNLGLVSAFPLFLRNALRWLGGDPVVGICPNLAVGASRAPEGYTVRWEKGPKGGPGVAVLYSKEKRHRLAVNFFCPGESALHAPGTRDARAFPVPQEQPPGADPWRAILWCALAVLGLDWGLLLLLRRVP